MVCLMVRVRSQYCVTMIHCWEVGMVRRVMKRCEASWPPAVTEGLLVAGMLVVVMLLMQVMM